MDRGDAGAAAASTPPRAPPPREIETPQASANVSTFFQFGGRCSGRCCLTPSAETARAPLLVVDRFSCGKALVRVVGQPRIPASWLSVAALKFYESDGTERRGPASREVGPLRRESRKRQR